MIINDKRELAYIAVITKVEPIEGYDRVETVTVNDGWKVIVSKEDHFKPEDFCVYFEIDSLCPASDERFAFLAKRKYRVKTQKMCKTISQGLVMPLSAFPEIRDITPNTPVTDLLGVKYYEPEDNARKASTPNPNAKYVSMCARHKDLAKKKWWRWLMKREWGKKLLFLFFGKKKDKPLAFPTQFPFVHKTDEERCLAGSTLIATEKGPIKLQDIVNKKLDVQVYSYDKYEDAIELKAITGYQKIELTDEDKLLVVEFGIFEEDDMTFDKIVCTDDHKFFTQRGYIQAKNLKTTDVIYTHDNFNNIVPATITTIRDYHLGKYVYDITVRGNHNFFANGILTHNCENMPWILGYENPLIVTEKLDGTSTTFILEKKKKGFKENYEFYVLSRNIRQKTPDQECYHDSNIYWEMALKYDVENKLKAFMKKNPKLDYVCIQGESVGDVQGNPLKLKENDFYAFNFIRSDVGRVSSVTGQIECKNMGIKWVPILDTEYMMPKDMEEFKLVADAKSVVNPDVLREGIVLRDPKTDLSFKNVSREYLLKH